MKDGESSLGQILDQDLHNLSRVQAGMRSRAFVGLYLSDQERRILELIAEGLTNREIGERVHLAEKTVKNYVSNLLNKLGMERRTQAAVYAARLQDGTERP